MNVVQPDAGPSDAGVVADGVVVLSWVWLAGAVPAGGDAGNPQDVSSRTELTAMPTAGPKRPVPGETAGQFTSLLSDRPQ